jgi:hypothetical protein
MNEKKAWFRLSKKSIKFLKTYYLALFIVGLIGLGLFFFYIFQLNEFTIFQKSIIGSVLISLTGSTIFYYRKLYKACINLDFLLPTSDEDLIRENGIKSYFLLRPLFSVIFSILFNVIVLEGIRISTEQSELKEGFIYTCVFLSFFAGFSSGDILDKLEEKGPGVVKKIIDR